MQVFPGAEACDGAYEVVFRTAGDDVNREVAYEGVYLVFRKDYTEILVADLESVHVMDDDKEVQ